MKRVRRFLLFLFSLTLFIMPLCVCVCVIRVHADTNTYVVFDDNCQTGVFYVNNNPYEYQNGNYTSEIRVAGFQLTNAVSFYAVSLNPFTCRGSLADTCTYGNFRDATSLTDSTTGNTFYARLLFSQNVNYTEGSIPITDLTDLNYTYGTPASEYVYTYTFGSGAVDPVDPVTWGLVDIEGYQTNVAGSGNAAINNVDVISWNDTFDTLSNDITEGNVRIRYVPGHYKAVDKPNLLQQLYTDFILDVVIDDAEGLYPVTDGSASFRWGQVIEDLSIPFYSIYNLSNSAEGWIKRGWIYQVRLEIDDYVGEWQTVYASTSSGVANDMEIVNTTTITQNTINAIQQVNTINDTTNIWIIYETPVDPNPEYQPPEDDDEKPWWVYLLEMINNSIGVTNEYISEGTDESVQVVNNINNNNDTLNQTVNEYDDIEDDLITDFNDNTNNIDLDDTLIGNNGFLNAARWISQQFTTITTDNPFGAILKFSLVLGFVLIFLGRFR